MERKGRGGGGGGGDGRSRFCIIRGSFLSAPRPNFSGPNIIAFSISLTIERELFAAAATTRHKGMSSFTSSHSRFKSSREFTNARSKTTPTDQSDIRTV